MAVTAADVEAPESASSHPERRVSATIGPPSVRSLSDSLGLRPASEGGTPMLLLCILGCALQFEFPMQQVPMGDGPTGLAVADLDLDGRPDLLTCDYGHTVSLRRGDGWGGFGELEQIPLANSTGKMLVDDLDGDGWPDVVASLLTAQRVAVLRGDGAGGLLAAVNYGVRDHPDALASGDVNGDGLQDLLVANSWGNSVSVLLGSGAAGFQPGPVVPTDQPLGVQLADLDLDGILELVVAGADTLEVHAGLGHGQFGPPVPNTVLASVVDLALGDLDENGIVDAVACASYGPKISVLLDNGAGGFDPYQQVYIESLHHEIGALILDFDEDDHADVVLSSEPDGLYNGEWGSLIRFFHGDGSGTLGTSVATPVADSNSRFVAADVVVDGHAGLLLIASGTDGVLLLPGDGHGGVPHMANSIGGSGVLEFGLGDADGDGLVDGA